MEANIKYMKLKKNKNLSLNLLHNQVRVVSQKNGILKKVRV